MTDLVVNGAPVTVEGDPDTPLLTVLRDDLGLVGTRFGCGQGLCGACFVRLGETVVPSCQTPVWQAEGQPVTTVEGLSAEGTPHPVQQALLDHQAAQCGFCISGIVVRAAALLEEEPDADADRVAEALDRNLCRCGAHRRIVDAVLAARPSPGVSSLAEMGVEERAKRASRNLAPQPPDGPVVEVRGDGLRSEPASVSKPAPATSLETPGPSEATS